MGILSLGCSVTATNLDALVSLSSVLLMSLLCYKVSGSIKLCTVEK